MIRQAVLSAIAAAALSTGAVAEPAAYNFDKSHTSITFTVNHLGFSTTHGRFSGFDGKLMIDETAPEASSVTVEIDTGSVDTFFEQRDTHLKSPDFFDVERFPSMIFTSTKVKKTGDKTLEVIGDLTLLGKTKPVTLDVVVPNLGAHPMSGTKTVGIRATATIKRSEWGMTTFVPAVGDDVAIVIDLEAAQVN